jgi:hypothetical protein
MPHNFQSATPALAFSTEFGTSPLLRFRLGIMLALSAALGAAWKLLM